MSPATSDPDRPTGSPDDRPAGGGDHRPTGDDVELPAGGGDDRPGGDDVGRPAGGGDDRPTGDDVGGPAGGGDDRPGGDGFERTADDGADGWGYVRLPVPAAPRRRGRALAVVAGAVLMMTVLGVPLGLIWSVLAPAVPVVQTEDGAILAQPQPEEFIAADGWFSLLGLVLGVLAAVAVWLILRRYRGPFGIVLVVVGMIGGAVLAWRVGRQVGLAGHQRLLETAPVGETFDKPPDLRAGGFEWIFGFVPTIQGDLLLPPFGAAVAYTLLAGWSRYPGLGAEPEPEEPALGPVSWDFRAPPTPTAAPAPPEPGGAEPPRD